MKLTSTIIRSLSLIFLFIPLSVLKGQVVINEYSCSNLSQTPDNYGDYEDWIELYNTSGSTVNLAGYYLSDDSLNNTKYQIPAGVTIAPNGFARFWCSGRDLASGTNYHTNFHLTQTKNTAEEVVLSDPSANILDHIKIKKAQLGHSRGRTFNGASVWSIFTTPTPNSSNNTATPYDDYADRPDYSLGAGFYVGSVTLAITTTEPNADIHYTLDGTLPTQSSPIYSTPLTISSTTTVKAVTYGTNPSVLKSFVEFETFFINVSHTIPVVSIAANQLTQLANGSGSLKPHGTWELFDVAGTRVAKTYGEFNRHGQDSWVLSQRSLDFISRDEMGYNHSVEEQIFASTPMQNFQRIILRAAGDDNYPADHKPANDGSAHIRDAYIHNLAIEGGMKLDVRRGAKCIVYLNNVYWGIYDMRDNSDDHDLTKYYYGQDKHHLYFIETWGNTWAEYGGQAAINEWNAFYNYAMNSNMNDPVAYQYVMDRYDATSLIDYVIVNSFTVCSDWLNYNTGWWRGLDSTGTHLKWGYILWDNDATFGHYINYTGIPNTGPNAAPCNVEGLNGWSDPEGHIDLLNKLRTNPEFNTFYINRQLDMWNTVFTCDNMLNALDSISAMLSPEMFAHAARWNGTHTEWSSNVQDLRDYISQRCNNLSGGFMGCYNLTGPHELTLNTDPAGAGSIRLNTIDISSFPWSGTYFGNITTSLEATANPNYSFTNWTPGSQVFNPGTTTPAVEFDLAATDSIIAHFVSTTFLPEVPLTEPSVGIFPNVISQSAIVEYNLPEAAVVNMKIYSVNGSEVLTLNGSDIPMNPGNYRLQLNLNNTGLQSGIYFLDFNAGKYRKHVKLIYTPQ